MYVLYKSNSYKWGDVNMLFESLVARIIAFFTAIITLLSGGAFKPDSGAEDKQYTVTFVNYDGKTVIATKNVDEGGYASAPNNPTKSGTDFLGWSGNYVNVNKDETVKAVFSDEKNVFVVSQTNGKKGDNVKIRIALKGSVKTCGFDMAVTYDSNLKLISYDDDLDLDIVVNSKSISNGVLLNYSSASNITKKKDIIELTFKITDSTKTVLPITITMNSIKEVSGNNVVNTKYTTINGIVFVSK